MYGHTYSKSIDQPGKVANPACGQLNREKKKFRSAFVPENLVSRDGFGNPVPPQPAHFHTQAESCAYLRDSPQVPRRRPYTVIIGELARIGELAPPCDKKFKFEMI